MTMEFPERTGWAWSRGSLGIVALLWVARIASARSEPPPRFTEWTMFIGEQKVLSARDLERYSEGKSGVVQIKIPKDASQMVVTAVQGGQTSLLLMYRDDRQKTILITVYARPPEAVMDELGKLLAGIPGVVIRQVGPKIFIEGTLPSEPYVQRAENVARLYPDQVVSLARVDPTRLESKVNIQLDVYFVLFSNRDGWRFGVDWPDRINVSADLGMTYDFNAGGWTSRTLALSSANLVGLDLFSYGGWVKVLKQPTLTTVNGNKATYKAGGEVKVPVTGIAGGGLETIPFGIEATITPRFDKDTGRVDLEVEAEASELDYALGLGGVPGRRRSNIKTLVNLKIGQTLMLSGINAKVEGKTSTGLPLLRHIPILGYLFRSDDFSSDEMNGVIFITPTVRDQVQDKDREKLKQMIQKYKAFDG